MTVDETIRTALSGIVDDIVPNMYEGKSDEYIYFNYNEYPDCFGDDTNDAMRYFVQVHYICPKEKNPNAQKKRIRAALNTAGGTPPTCVNAGDSEQQHYTYEFYLGGAADGEV